ncbi:MAG: hypothetical protein QW680_10905 [Pyrobaculum sp.]|jgi:hypothetical protein|uniref:hypothetical protein n=1 Tax=Pyrobaculum aerophilum TaxID=13773 RepID=UPI002FDB91FC
MGFILDVPVVTLTVFNATEKDADSVAMRIREIVPCRYPIVYFVDELYLYPLTDNTDLHSASSSAGGLVEQVDGMDSSSQVAASDGGAVKNTSAISESALVADGPAGWMGVVLAVLSVALLAMLAAALRRWGNN